MESTAYGRPLARPRGGGAGERGSGTGLVGGVRQPELLVAASVVGVLVDGAAGPGVGPLDVDDLAVQGTRDHIGGGEVDAAHVPQLVGPAEARVLDQRLAPGRAVAVDR